MHKKTPEEKFLNKAYEVALSFKDPFHEMDAFEIGALLGHREHKIKIIIQHLSKCSFIQKRGSFFILTEKGIDCAKSQKS